MLTRRSFLRVASGLLVAAPAIVRAESLMPVRRPLAVPRMFAEFTVLPRGFPGVAFGELLIVAAPVPPGQLEKIGRYLAKKWGSDYQVHLRQREYTGVSYG